jgi:hypothetical protein
MTTYNYCTVFNCSQLEYVHLYIHHSKWASCTCKHAATHRSTECLQCMCSSSFLMLTAALSITCTNCCHVFGLSLWYALDFKQPHRKKSMGISQATVGDMAQVHHFLNTSYDNCHWGTLSPLCQNVEMLHCGISTFTLILQEACPLSTVVGHFAENASNKLL